jgi:hypothetical protein
MTSPLLTRVGMLLALAAAGTSCGDGVQEDEGAVETATPRALTACSTLTVYMAPSGLDSNSGLSSSKPVKTLTRVQAVIQAYAPACPTVVKVGLGTYYDQSVTWTYRSGYEIKLEPADGYASQVRPVFDGCTSSSGACTQRTWFAVSALGATKLSFRYLRVQRYSTAISFNGNRDVEAQSIRDNRIYGMYFRYIGNGWAGAEAHTPSTAAVRFVNADDNFVENSHFYDVTNRTSLGNLHALYIAHSSDRNYVARNVLENISGDPIRVRDYGFQNVIDGNRITKAGVYAYSEWFCDSASRDDCTKPDECWSWENTFSNNTLDGKYDCSTLLVFNYSQTNVPANCTRPARGAVRLHTWGNVKTTTPCSM